MCLNRNNKIILFIVGGEFMNKIPVQYLSNNKPVVCYVFTGTGDTIASITTTVYPNTPVTLTADPILPVTCPPGPNICQVENLHFAFTKSDSDNMLTMYLIKEHYHNFSDATCDVSMTIISTII